MIKIILIIYDFSRTENFIETYIFKRDNNDRIIEKRANKIARKKRILLMSNRMRESSHANTRRRIP